MSASSLIDAALGVPSRQSSAVNIGGTSAIAARVAEQEVHVGPIWGSFERNTGTWTPYSVAENRLIESAFHSGVATVEVPTCFNAVVHFNRAGGYHHQMTPAAGTKPPGFRSVLRGTAGESATLYWWEETRLWRLETATPITHTQEVGVSSPPTAEDTFTWQWCDLTGQAAADSREINWHPYTAEHGAEVEDAWSRKVTKEITVGLTTYRVGGWQGSYGFQENLTTGIKRQVRRGRISALAATPADFADESCALCTESFADTPEWPIRRTPCNHAFHWTCLQHILRNRSGQPKCPMCRRSLQGMSAGGTTGGVNSGNATGAGMTGGVFTGLVHPANLASSSFGSPFGSNEEYRGMDPRDLYDPRELYGMGGAQARR